MTEATAEATNESMNDVPPTGRPTQVRIRIPGAHTEAVMSNVIDTLRYDELRDDLPEFGIGDTIRVAVRIKEGGKERLQKFEGAVISIQGTGLEKTLTVRKLTSGIAVERIFPLESPNVANIQVVKRGRVRRAKLFYLRHKRGRKARIREARRK